MWSCCCSFFISLYKLHLSILFISIAVIICLFQYFMMILIKQENKWYLILNKLRPCDQKMIPSRDDTWMESGDMNENTEYNYSNDRCPSHAIEAHTQSRLHILNNRCRPRYSSLLVWQRNSHSKRDFCKNTNKIKSFQSSKVYPSAITLKKNMKNSPIILILGFNFKVYDIQA